MWTNAWIIVAVAVADAVLLPVSGFSLVLSGEKLVMAGVVMLVVLCVVYGRLRLEPRLAALAGQALRFVLFTNAAGLLSYLLTSLWAGPLLDAHLVAADRALGLDWLAGYQWLHAHPALAGLAHLVYASSLLQIACVTLALPLVGDFEAAHEWFWLFAVSALIVVIAGALLPAAGAYVAYGVPEAWTEPYVQQYLSVHSGTLRMFDVRSTQGIVQFPSFHAALAVLCTWASRRVALLFFVLLPLNVLVLVSTPYAGGHHFVDVFAGMAIAAALIGIRQLCRRVIVSPVEPRTASLSLRTPS